MRNFKRFLIPAITLAATCILPIAVFAKPINLLDTPQDNAKVIGTVDLSTGVIPIFTPKDSAWIKVANPANGETGWIKKSDLKDNKGNVVSVQQQVTEDKNGGKTQSVQMSYGDLPQMTPEQKKLMEQSLMMQQKNTQQSMQLIQQNLEQMRNLYHQQIQILQSIGFPVVPGMGMPAKPTNTNNMLQAPAATVAPSGNKVSQ